MSNTFYNKKKEKSNCECQLPKDSFQPVLLQIALGRREEGCGLEALGRSGLGIGQLKLPPLPLHFKRRLHASNA